MIFMLGFAQPMKSMIAYSHLMEFLPNMESKISGIFMFFDGIVVVITPLLIHIISEDLTFLMEIAMVLNILSLIGFLVLRIPESTKFQIINRKFSGLRQSMKRIKKLGGLSDESLEVTR